MNHLPFFHDYQPVAVHQITTTPDAPLSTDETIKCLQSGIMQMKTRILWRCRCGAVRDTKVNGHWTLAEILGTGRPVQHYVDDGRIGRGSKEGALLP